MKCYAPWHALSIRFNGDVVPDCVYDGRHGNLLTDTLPEIFEHIGLQQTRSAIANGTLPSNCRSCIKKESMVGHSRRIFFETALNPLLKEYDYSKPVNDIYFLEFNMSNLCNLKCRMCSGVNSTAWVKEDIKLSKNPILRRPITNIEFGYRNVPTDIVDRLFAYPEYFKNLQYVNIKGGEPYMEPANKDIMRHLIRLGYAKNITLDISTNGTIVDEEFDALAKQFKHTIWHISIEGVGKMYEYMRGGDNFKFEQLEANLKHFEKFDRLIFAGTVSAYNVFHLDEIKKWFDSIKKDNFELYLLNVVATPDYLNPGVLPAHLLEGTRFKHDPVLEHELPAFIEFTKSVDALRGTNVLDVAPELRELFT